jgi:hypothetical protein
MISRALRIISWVCVLTLVIASCSSTQQMRRNGPDAKLSASASIYVALPEDGRYGSTLYTGSGDTTVRELEGAFQRRVNRVERGNSPETREQALERARAKGCDVCLLPKILNWEDRATEWSGQRDWIEIQLILIDVARSATLDTATIESKSAFLTFGGDHPQDLLRKPVEAYVDSLF